MKKFFKVIACIIIICSIIPSKSIAYADIYETNNFLDIGTQKDNLCIVKNYEINNKSKDFTFIDFEKLTQNIKTNTYNSDIITYGTRKETYSHSSYEVLSYDLISPDSKSTINETFLVSVPEGYTLKLGTSKTVSGSITISGGLGNSKEKSAISKTFGLSGTGTISKTWSKDETFSFPSSYTGIYRTANYYAAIGFDYYRIQVYKYDVYIVEYGNVIHPQKRNENTYYAWAYVPKVVMFTKGANY